MAATRPGERPKRALEALDKSVDQANLLVGIFFGLVAYFFLTIVSINDRDLLIGGDVELPLFRSPVPLGVFAVCGPILVVGFHFAVLLHQFYLEHKLEVAAERFLRDGGERAKSASLGREEGLRDYVHVLALPVLRRLSGGVHPLAKGASQALFYLIYVFLPVLSLIVCEATFLPYRKDSVFWAQKVAMLVDCVFLVLWGPVTYDLRQGSEKSAGEGDGAKEWVRRFWAAAAGEGFVSFLVFLALAWIVFSVPLFGLGLAVDSHGECRRTWAAGLWNIDLAGEVLLADEGATLNFSRRDLRCADFTGAVIEGADFRGAALDGARFDSASLKGSSFMPVGMTELSLTALPRVEKAEMISASKREGVGVTRLSRASFVGSDLRRSRFALALGQEADFRFARVAGADFTGAELRGARFDGARGECLSFFSARLDEAVFREAELSGSDLSLAWAQGSDFLEVGLEFADLRDARLVGVRLAGGRLAGSDFRGAVLVGADLRSADLTGSSGIGPRWPSALDLRGAWLAGASFEDNIPSPLVMNGEGELYIDARGVRLRQFPEGKGEKFLERAEGGESVCSMGTAKDIGDAALRRARKVKALVEMVQRGGWPKRKPDDLTLAIELAGTEKGRALACHKKVLVDGGIENIGSDCLTEAEFYRGEVMVLLELARGNVFLGRHLLRLSRRAAPVNEALVSALVEESSRLREMEQAWQEGSSPPLAASGVGASIPEPWMPGRPVSTGRMSK